MNNELEFDEIIRRITEAYEMIPILDIDQEGNIHTLYNDKIDLYSLGLVTDVRRASYVEFNEIDQTWEVVLPNGSVIHREKNREKAIEKEIELVGPGGKYYEG